MERYNTGFKVPVTGIIGAIYGDVICSAYEFHPTDDYNFEPFVKRTLVTDDSVATPAVDKWFMGERSSENLVDVFLGVCNRHPNAGWGGRTSRSGSVARTMLRMVAILMGLR